MVSGEGRAAGVAHRQHIRRTYLAFEWASFAVACIVLIVFLKKMLLLGQTTMTHDTVLWVYPVFTYLADCV
jgi:hypothetical protein